MRGEKWMSCVCHALALTMLVDASTRAHGHQGQPHADPVAGATSNVAPTAVPALAQAAPDTSRAARRHDQEPPEEECSPDETHFCGCPPVPLMIAPSSLDPIAQPLACAEPELGPQCDSPSPLHAATPRGVRLRPPSPPPRA